jgi:L-ascorbate metabolism protein UlaG (beta-lactamase superfamily)
MPTGKALIEQMNRITIVPDSLAIWGMGQMGVAIKGPDGIIYIDPCLTNVVFDTFHDERWTRGYPSPLDPHDITNAGYVLCSHEHLDHLDPQTVGGVAVASPGAKFLVTGWSVDILSEADIGPERVMVPRVGEPMTLPGTSLKLTTIPASHYEKEYDEEKGYRWFGFILEWNGVVFYHGGDTIIFPGYIDLLKGLPKADVAMLAMNGRDWFREERMNAVGNLLPEEGVQLAQELGWDVLIPGHNDLFPHNAIPMAQITGAFEKFGPRQKYKFLQPGELYYYVK